VVIHPSGSSRFAATRVWNPEKPKTFCHYVIGHWVTLGVGHDNWRTPARLVIALALWSPDAEMDMSFFKEDICAMKR